MKIRLTGLFLAASLLAVQELARSQPTNAPAATTSVTSAPPANPSPPPSGPPKKSAAELEKLVLPIALHPDPLIAIILPAAAYPLEIVQAARFVKDTNNIPKVDAQAWDDNVKELAKFPDMIAKMDADLSWTMELGEAFINQPKELMDTIQDLRSKAKKAGTLQTTPQQIVTVTNIVVLETNVTQVTSVTKEVVQVAPANPQVVYVPSYPPTVYYPPPSYVYNPYAPLVTFGVGMAWGAILANNCNWGHGHVDIDIDHNVNRNVNRNVDRNTTRPANAGNRSGQQQWKPDQNRRSTAGASPASRDARGWGSTQPTRSGTTSWSSTPATGNRAGAGQSTHNFSQQPRAGSQPARSPGAGSSAQRPSQGASRPSQAPVRSSPSPSSYNRPSGQSAFSGVNSGSSARAASSRGATSRGGGGGGGRGGGRR